MLTPDQKDRIRTLSLALVGKPYILGTEVNLEKIDPAMGIEDVRDLVPAIDCSEMVQVVFKWATGKTVVDLAANQFDHSIAIQTLGRLDPELGDLGFKRIEDKIAHVGIYIGKDDGIETVVEARGKAYGVVKRNALTGWQAQTVFAGWRHLKLFLDSV